MIELQPNLKICLQERGSKARVLSWSVYWPFFRCFDTWFYGVLR